MISSCYIFSRQQSPQPSASFVGMYPPVFLMAGSTSDVTQCLNTLACGSFDESTRE